MRSTRPGTRSDGRPTDALSASGQRGFALIGTILLLFLLAGLVASLSLSGQTAVRISQNYEAETKARAAAEAGLNHALAVVIDDLTQWSTHGFASASLAITARLKGPDGLTGTTTTNADNGSLENLGAIVAQRIPRPPARRVLSADQWYEARVFDEDDPARGVTLSAADIARIGEDNIALGDHNERLVVRAIGYGPKDTQVTLEAIVGFGASEPAIVVNGDLSISGSVHVGGSGGSVQGNGNVDVSGSPDITGNVSATGTYHQSGSPTVGGTSGGGYPPVAVANIRALDHRADADYILTSTGRITNQAGTVLCNATTKTGCPTWGWSYSHNAWDASGNTLTNGIYYVQGDVTINGNLGGGTPVLLTILSEGSIDVSGTLRAQAKLAGIFLLADGDIQMLGTLTQSGAEARVLVREQVDIGGHVSLLGQVIVQNVSSVASLVQGSTQSFSGSASVTYSGGLGGGAGGPTVMGWRQM
jgi:hypothetical protein